jgi:adenylate cyclase
MGNTVNLAARLEGVNKQYGTWILASEDTIRETGNLLLTRKLDRVRVMGINEPVRLYELLEKRDWNQAIEGFRESLAIINNDVPSQKYLDQSRTFVQSHRNFN